MGVLGKIKNFFVEEVEEDEEEEEEVVQQKEPEQQFARKVEVPKKSFRERFKLRERLEEEEEDEEETEQKVELEEQEPNVYIPKNNNLDFEEEEITPKVEPEVTMEEEEEEVALPTRSSRTPLVFEDENLFQEDDDYKPEINNDFEEEDEEEYDEPVEEEEEEPAPPPKEKYRPPLLYQSRKESNYIDSMNKDTYSYKKEEPKGEKKFKPSPIISPIYGILDKNYKKDEIKTKNDKNHNDREEKTLDTIRKKAYGEEVKEEPKVEKKEEKPIKSEKKLNLNRDVPAVSDITIAAADEYYNELGLVYNENYKDVSRSQPSKKREEPKKKNSDDDNLFRVVGLADSMYDKKED